MKAKVGTINGVPLVFVDGRLLTGQAYGRSVEQYSGRERLDYEDVLATYRQQAANGCRFFLFGSTCSSDFYSPRLETWIAPETFDYSHVDRFMQFIEAECPDALVMPKINLFAPTWWEDRHPEELQRFHDGSIEADGRAEIEELEKIVAIDLLPDEADEDIETLGGLVFSMLGRVPQIGEVITHSAGVEFEIVDADLRRVKRLMIRHGTALEKNTDEAEAEGNPDAGPDD